MWRKLRSLSVRSWLGIVLLVSTLLKIIEVLINGHSYSLGSDDKLYIETARIWLEEGMLTYNDPTRPTMFITPALPAFIAIFMKWLGTGYELEQTLRIVQVLMVTFALYLLFQIGTRIFNEKAALLAVTLTAFYLPMWLVSFLILTEALFVLAVMLLIYTALKAMDKPTLGVAAAFGLAWVFAVYVRPTIALWPGLFLLLLLYWRTVPWKKLLTCLSVASVIFVLCLLPWWVRNYEVSGGRFIPLTQSSGNPLLLGTFPFGPPTIEEQRTWPRSDHLAENDAYDTKWAKERIKEGFTEQPLYYLQWYTAGKFTMFWGDVYYWVKVHGINIIPVILMHYFILIYGFKGIWQSRRNRLTLLLTVLFAYMTLLHMVYLAHSRYTVPLMPFMALFASYAILNQWNKRNNPRITGDI
ncbi:ArnT family glycosyltransferase [Paenibacillus lutrae]|uniref:Glycosyltransferase RgtA/B/C/D-like domain-containing protein n=1 Tax=Paenibacillus lutrae TaxID=2078573 RepID=A0A7X3FJI2_9BACL|nr:glycosyltransferase family 39 protein [Paenibacillus lutrae]MVP00883.1 hypothetical protein [Paenibacillus lutrae]